VTFITLFLRHSLLIVAKRVSWTLDPDRPRKTGSRYKDTLSCFGKPKGSVTMSQKITVLFHCLLGDFWQKLHWGYLYPPVAGTRVKPGIFLFTLQSAAIYCIRLYALCQLRHWNDWIPNRFELYYKTCV